MSSRHAAGEECTATPCPASSRETANSDFRRPFVDSCELQSILDHAPVALAMFDREMRYIKATRRWCSDYGLGDRDLRGVSHYEVFPEIPERWKDAHRRGLSGETLREENERFERADGSVQWVRWEIRPWHEKTGAIGGIVIFAEEITQRKQAEEALRESEHRERAHAKELETVLEAVPVPVVITRDPECRTVTTNRAGRALFRLQDDVNVSLSAPEAERLSFRYLRDGVEIPSEELSLQRAARTGEAAFGESADLRFQDGSIRHLIGNAVPLIGEDGKPRGAIGAAIDLTERVQAEAELRQREAELQEAQRVAHMGSWRLDLRTGSVTWSEQFARELCLDPALLSPSLNGLTKLLTPEGWSNVMQALERIERTGEIKGTEVSFHRADGRTGWALVRGMPDRHESGNVVGLHGVALDITERKQIEAALRESEERLRLAQEVAQIGTFERSLSTGSSTWCPQMQALYGLPSGVFPKTVEEFIELVYSADRQKVKDLVERSYKTGEGHGEWRVTWPDGSMHWIAGRWKVFKDNQGRPLRALGMDFDITERKRVEEALRKAKDRLSEEKSYLEQTIVSEMGFEEIIGKSQGLRNVMELVTKVAVSNANVLLLGETGVGKELVARAIHRLSPRRIKSFIKMNCAAIPLGLLESELFGAEKGAYTGSVSRKIGRLELADKGTIFLDEIGEIALSLQPKLLRVLQDQEFERLGGTKTLKVDFRLIAATNRDLGESVKANEFRSDLYYRLNVFPIRVPPLRERRDDIPLLVEHFVQKCARRMNKKVTSIPQKTMDTLAAWDWPGNIRELENFLERSVILTHGSVLAAPLGELQRPVLLDAEDETLRAAERRHILRALQESRGRISGFGGAAARLGLKRTTLQAKLKHLGIDRRRPPV